MEQVNDACHKILSNPIIEGYNYTLKTLEE
jgi:phosphoribosylformylglycinamidine (FGAM) synthase PurS component